MLLRAGTKILAFLVLICSSGTPVKVVISNFSSTVMSCVSRVWSCASLHVEVLNDLVETLETETAATVPTLLPHNACLSRVRQAHKAEPWSPTLLSHLCWDSRGKGWMTLECRRGSGSGVGVRQRKPCSVRSVLTGAILGGREPESCRGQVGGWEQTSWKWPWALQAFLVQSWGRGWETLPSASLPGHQGGNRLPRGPSLAPADHHGRP